MKIKLPKGANAQNGQTIIVVKEKKSGCGGGCLLALLLSGAVCWVMFSCFQDQQQVAAEIREREASMTPAERAARDMAKPLDEVVALNFDRALRKNLKDPDSYNPGSIRYHDHPQGYAYFHEYRAKNGFGGYVKEICGLLCATNSGKRVWTFYNQDAVTGLFKECGVE